MSPESTRETTRESARGQAAPWSSEMPRRAEDAAWRMVDGEMIVVSASTGRITALNRTGGFVWEQADGSKSVDDLVQGVCERFDIERDVARTDVLDFLDALGSEGLIETGSGAARA